MTDQARRWEGECPWKRVVLKLSGEALADPVGENISGEVLQNLASEIASVREVHGDAPGVQRDRAPGALDHPGFVGAPGA